MPTPKKTLKNPHGLTGKQRLAARFIVDDIIAGNGLNQTKNHGMVYQAKPKSLPVIASNNINNVNFREEIIDGLRERHILGKNGKISTKLSEGLEAVVIGTNNPNYTARLAYIQEINKLLGVYAPTRVDSRNLTLKGTVTPEDLRREISTLQEELLQ